MFPLSTIGSRRLVLAVALALGLTPLAKADWPHLRGPNYDGVSAETGLAAAWPAEGPPRLWTRELGQGHSGFVIAEGRLYTQRQTLAGQYLVCLDPDTGQTLWETRYDWAWQPKGAYPGPYATPTWHGGKVYYASPTGLVGCMDAKTGVPLWSVNVREKFDGNGYGFGFAATPLVEEGRVIVPVGGPSASLVALDCDDGRTLWTAGSDPASYCPAFPITLGGRRYVVGYLENALLLVESVSGKVAYRQPLSKGYDEHSAWPIYREPHLLLTGPFGVAATRYELAATPDLPLTLHPNWTGRDLCNDILSSVLYEGHVYGFDLKQAQASKHRASRGVFKCLDWSTGALRWASDQVGHASVLAADGKLFMVNDTGALMLAWADPSAYRELGRVQLFEDEICWTPPALRHGRLFVRSPSRAVCLYVGAPENMLVNPSHDVSTTAARAWHIDASWLLSRERDYPNDAFSREEMTLWFASSLFMLLLAAILTSLAQITLEGVFGWKPPAAGTCWPVAFLLGLLGPNTLSVLFDHLLFTWPLCVYAVLQGTILTCLWVERSKPLGRGRWPARGAMVALIVVCYGYYELCKLAGMFVAWSFLFGLLPAFPLAWLAARATTKAKMVAWTMTAFSVFFWTCAGFLWWKGS